MTLLHPGVSVAALMMLLSLIAATTNTGGVWHERSIAMRCGGGGDVRCARHVYTVHTPFAAAHVQGAAADYYSVALDFGAPPDGIGGNDDDASIGASVRLRVNAVDAGTVAMLPSSAAGQQQRRHVHTRLALRPGVNVVELIGRAGRMPAGLKVTGALLAPAAAGAALPYVELEAEDATYVSGTRIGPNYTYSSLPSEASARTAVSLAPGQAVDFVVPAGVAANAMVLRASVPDAPGGGGLQGTLAVSLNGGSPFANVSVDSFHSWYYGAYPFTKNPADGNPHHFYDEYSVWLPGSSVGPGDVLRVANPAAAAAAGRGGAPSLASGGCGAPPPPDPAKKDCGFSGITQQECLAKSCCWVPITPNPHNYPWCYVPAVPPAGLLTITLDLIDLYSVGPPASPPPSSVSVVDYGADPSGRVDSTAAVVAAIAAAGAARVAVWVPPGNYTVTAHIALPDNTTIVGAGPWYAAFRGLDVGLYGGAAPRPSVNVHVQGLALVGDTRIRDDSRADTGIGNALSDSIIADVYVSHTKCGMWLDGPFENLLISGARIHDTTADGVNFHRGVAGSVVEHSWLRNTGDDCLAMWSDGVPDTGCTFRYNTAAVPVLANNIAIYGGSDNAARSNLVVDTLVEGGGLHVGNRFGAVPLGGTTTLDGNVALRAGQLDLGWHFGVGAVWFYALDAPLTGRVVVSNTTILDSPWEAFQFIGSSVTNVTIRGATVRGVGSFVFQLQCSGAAAVADVVATGAEFCGVYNCSSGGGAAFTLVDGGGNAGWASSHCGWPPGA